MFTPAQKKQLMELPGFVEIKEQHKQVGGMKMHGKGMKKMHGGSFWSDLWDGIKSTAKDVDAWLRRTKALSTAGKVIGAITAVIPGLQEVAPVALAAAKAGEAMGFGKMKHKGGMKKKHGGMKKMHGGMTANDLGQHVNPVAGARGFVSHGMGTYVQNHQSPQLKMLGGTYPSHLQPFLTTRTIGRGIAQAVGSIGDRTKIKF